MHLNKMFYIKYQWCINAEESNTRYIFINVTRTWKIAILQHVDQVKVAEFCIISSWPILPSLYSDCKSVESCRPENSSTICPLKKAESCTATPDVGSRPYVSSDYPDKLSARLENSTHHPQILRETRSRGSSKISRQECPLCSKVWHFPICLLDH